MQRFGFDLDDHSLAGVDVVGISSGGGFVDIPGGTFLLRASFDRLGPDLVLSHEDQVFLLKDYFRFENPPDLLSSGGSVINSDLANKLAGPPTPGQFAQLSGVASDTSVGGQSIGKKIQRDDLTLMVRQLHPKAEDFGFDAPVEMECAPRTPSPTEVTLLPDARSSRHS